MCKNRLVPYDLQWIYDTILSVDECIRLLIEFQESNSWTWSSVSCNKKTNYVLELTFRQPTTGAGKPKRTRYTAEFYAVEKGWTAIVLRFVDELFLSPPFTSIEEIDDLFGKILQAHRRQ